LGISIPLTMSNPNLGNSEVIYRLDVLINKAAGDNTRRRLILNAPCKNHNKAFKRKGVNLEKLLKKMKQVTLHIPDKKYQLFMEFAKSIDFIKKIDVEDEEPTKEQVLQGVKQAVKEINLVKVGKLKAKDARQLIHEI